jgi:hypothetical protein
MTTVAYAPLTQAEQVFKTLIWTPIILMGETALKGVEATIPMLDLPIFQDLEDGLINAITDAIFNQIVLFIDVESIELVNAELQSKWASASESLALIATEQGVDSDVYKTALSTAAADFANWVNTGPH